MSTAIRRALETIRDTFRKDEAQGFHSRDRQFAIGLAEAALHAEPEGVEELQRRIAELQAALRAIAGSHGNASAGETSSLAVALERWAECVKVAKEALGEA